MEDSAIQADSRSLATLLLIRDIQVIYSLPFYYPMDHEFIEKVEHVQLILQFKFVKHFILCIGSWFHYFGQRLFIFVVRILFTGSPVHPILFPITLSD